MAHDVFISYSDKDRLIVSGICAYLEQNGIRCFVAYRDIPKGVVWAGAITDAIEECQLMVIVYSENFNNSKQVDREIQLCSDAEKPMLNFRLCDASYNKIKKYYLLNINHLDAFPNPEEEFGTLLKSIETLFVINKPSDFTGLICKKNIENDICSNRLDESDLIIEKNHEQLLFDGLNYSAKDYFEKGQNAEKKDDFELAKKYYQMAIQEDSSHTDSYNFLGVLYGKMGDLDKSIFNLKKAIEIDPVYHNALVNVGISYGRQNDLKSAFHAFDKAISINPNGIDAYLNKGIFLKNSGNMDGAIDTFNHVISLDRENKESYLNLGDIFAEIGNYEKAIIAYQEAIKIDNKYTSALYNLGATQYDHMKYVEAISAFTQVISINSNNSDAYFFLGSCYYMLDDYLKSIECFTKSIHINPNHPDTYFALGKLYGKNREYDNAIVAYQKAISIKPDDAEAYFGMGISYYAKEDFNKEKECYIKGAQLGHKTCQEWLKNNNETW
jgi:tetratricopeptide (TPR) repeat protein